MIDHVMIMNLKRREDKWWFALGWLAKLDFPMNETIIRFESHDGELFGSTDAVVNAAVADGFPHLEKERGNEKYRDVAWMWTWSTALREIIEMDKIVLLLIDDTLPVWSWERLRSLVHHVSVLECGSRDNRNAFKVIQLNKVSYPDRKAREVEIYDPILAKGVEGWSDFGTILNREGAQLLFDDIEDKGGLPPWSFFRFSRKTERISGLWHTLDDAVELVDPFPWGSDLYRGGKK